MNSISDRILDRELADEHDGIRMQILGSRLREGYVNYKRYLEILNIISKHGFGFLFDKLKNINITSKLAPEKEELKKYSKGTRLRLMFEDLGPTFIKIGQILSTRPDLVPEEYITELEHLRDNVEPIPEAEVNKIIENELGQKGINIFKTFKKSPIGAASIGQVHIATTKSGLKVAVKVQRPNVKNKILADMEILEDIAEMFGDMIGISEVTDPVDLVKEFKRLLSRELDYTIEARSIEHFWRDFENDEDVILPKVYWEYTTKRVLTMDFISGIPIDELDKIKKANIDPNKVALILGQAVAKMIFVKGYFHGDPHGGNVLVLSGGKIAFLDFGSIGFIDEKTRDKIRLFYLYIAKENVSGAVDVFLDICHITESKVNRPALEQDFREFLDYQKLQRNGYKIDEGMNQRLVSIALKHKFMPPPQFILLERSLLEAEGVARELSANFDINEMLMPILGDIIQEKISTSTDPIRAMQTAQEYRELVRKGPKKVSSILEKLDSGSLTVKVDTSFIDELRHDIWRIFLIYGISLISLVMLFLITFGGLSLKIPIFNISITIIPIFIVWMIAIWWIYHRWKGPK
ncbi:MAG: ABC1 kinase family protein [Candidatus Thorarchaeota archaeon]